MSLRNKLPKQVIADLAVVLHKGVCCEHLEDEDLDDDEQTECVVHDMETVMDLLDVLDANGVGLVRGIDIPFRLGSLAT